VSISQHREYETALDMARAACARRRSEPLVHYFASSLTGSEVDDASDALASALASRGVAPGDRIGLYLQNVPQLPIAVIAAWKAGAIAVPINPMLKQRELELVLRDSGTRLLITLEQLYDEVAGDVIGATAVEDVVTTSPLEYLDTVPQLLANTERLRPPTTADFGELVASHAGERLPDPQLRRDDIAFLVYTSGTTGPPKGAMNLHRNVVFTSGVWRDAPGLTGNDVNLALAPLFHITGLIAGLGATLAAACPMVLGYRFDPATTLDLMARHRVTYTVAAITAYTALMNAPAFAEADMSRLRLAYTGGAPVPPSVAAAWEEATGVYLHNAYGLTETTSPLTLTPLGQRSPVDERSGALSVGKAVADTTIEVLGDDGQVLPPGEAGEIAASGPQVVPGYWQKPEETDNVLRDGRLRTGDVGYVDDEGWVYLIDRSKDLIIASGYKVWPREVEDVLYDHPAIREAAVVGVPDPYRGETVKAYVSLRPDASVTPEELVGYCRERLAAYKYPREIELVAELPKTPTGKILRRALRDTASAAG
jgi:long-chain acyl-CoA synthetase